MEDWVFEKDENAGLFGKRYFDKELVKELRTKREELKRWEAFFYSGIDCKFRFYTETY